MRFPVQHGMVSCLATSLRVLLTQFSTNLNGKWNKLLYQV